MAIRDEDLTGRRRIADRGAVLRAAVVRAVGVKIHTVSHLNGLPENYQILSIFYENL